MILVFKLFYAVELSDFYFDTFVKELQNTYGGIFCIVFLNNNS